MTSLISRSIVNGISFLSMFTMVAVLAAPALADPLPGEVLKFEQLPLNFGQFPSTGGAPFFGHDERSTAYLNTTGVGYSGSYVADDFSDLVSTPVVHVQWWGSYANNYLGNNPAQQGVQQFLISFESDVPATGNVASHPGTVLSSEIVNLTVNPLTPASGDFTEKLINGATPGDHLYQYNAELSLPFGELANTVYWMKIVALTTDPQLGWGWHNRDYGLTNGLFGAASPGESNIGPAAFPVWHFQDDAVVGGISNIIPIVPGNGASFTQTGFSPLLYQAPDDYPGGIVPFSEDMAFRLYTTPEPGSIVLMALGAVGLVALTYRRRKAARLAVLANS